MCACRDCEQAKLPFFFSLSLSQLVTPIGDGVGCKELSGQDFVPRRRTDRTILDKAAAPPKRSLYQLCVTFFFLYFLIFFYVYLTFF